MKKIIVTGGAGFIGSEFVKQAIDNGHKVIGIDNLTYAGDMIRLNSHVNSKYLTFYQCDIKNKELIDYIFNSERPSHIVHFAAESHVDRSIIDSTPFIETNVMGTMVLLELARKYEIEKFINISTDEVYGELLDEVSQFYETSNIKPSSPYSVSKASADMLGQAYYRTHGVPVITIRPSNNYGHWQYPEKLVPVVIIKALSDSKIPVYGEGKNIREWLYVSDCAEGVFQIIEKGIAGQIYNLGSGEEKTNIDCVNLILNIMDKPKSLIENVQDRLGHDFKYSLNSEKVYNQIGWKSKTTFEIGIEKTVKWYLDNKSWVMSKIDYLETYWSGVYKNK